MVSETSKLYVALLHENMVDKQGKLVTTSLTLIDIHDIARSTRTYGVRSTFIAHPSSSLRKLSRTLKSHWEEGFGASYNPNRGEALSFIQIVSDLDEVIQRIDEECGELPLIVATSARPGANRQSYESFRSRLQGESRPFLLLFGTGWGMSEELLNRADFTLDPLLGPGEYNHLSVRSACAIILDRLLSPQTKR